MEGFTLPSCQKSKSISDKVLRRFDMVVLNISAFWAVLCSDTY